LEWGECGGGGKIPSFFYNTNILGLGYLLGQMGANKQEELFLTSFFTSTMGWPL
jgi:hypothetical protein